MLSVTKLYDYLNWAFALVAILIITTLLSTVLSYYAIEDTVVDTSQFVQNSVDNARQNIREDLNMEKVMDGTEEITKIYQRLEFEGNLDEDKIKRLKIISEKCPVHKTLVGKVVVEEMEWLCIPIAIGT